MEGQSLESLFIHVRGELRELIETEFKLEQEMDNIFDENLTFLRCMVSQAGTNEGPLMPKTPKVTRKNAQQRIETIHEDQTVEFETTRADNPPEEDTVAEDTDVEATSNRRSTRTAAKKATNTIKIQQSTTLRTKMRRPDDNRTSKKQQERRSSVSSEDEGYVPVRQSRAKKLSVLKKEVVKDSDSEEADGTFVVAPVKKKKSSSSSSSSKQVEVSEEADGTFVAEPVKKKKSSSSSSSKEARVSGSKRKREEARSPSPKVSNRRKSSRIVNEKPAVKKAKIIDESMERSSLDNTLESSIYEDAIGKPAPIHNSTKIIDTTMTVDSKTKKSDPKNHMNTTVVLESNPKNMKTFCVDDKDDIDDVEMVDCTPEVKTMTKGGVQGLKAKVSRVGKNANKGNALFSPYALDSVKKRVAAFEQAGLNSPKSTEAETDAPTRVTRTKTRAMAAAAASEQPVQSIGQKLARKSLARAKKISLAKQTKESDDGKENHDNSTNAPQKPQRLLAINEKLIQKQQLRITPSGKSRLQQPMSVNRLQVTPSNTQPLSSHSRAMSASRTNILTCTESFTKQIQKTSLNEKLEEKRRKANEEDARRKKDEALKALTEEKKRKREEKEQRNKMAREAKDRLEAEKRIKAEKEREEKARMAMQMQEKQREELERKKQLQLQRAQEKEEKRRQEEQLRQQRLQEQEDMERQLAEQKRKELEAAERAHKQRHAEAKAQQQALAEAAKIKAQYQAKQAKLLNNTHTIQKHAQNPTSYKIESEPDEDDDASDTEDAPKHAVPSWAQSHVRREQLALQKYIPSYEAHRYFGSRQCTPDLTQIFENIDRRRLQRTSSANWKTPPRFSMMPMN